jgi:hypothetical protein
MSQENQQHNPRSEPQVRGFHPPIDFDFGFEDESDFIPRYNPKQKEHDSRKRDTIKIPENISG